MVYGNNGYQKPRVVMQKKALLLPFALAGAMIIGCSDDSNDSNPLADLATTELDPSLIPDPNSQDPNAQPGDGYTAPAQQQGQNGSTDPNNPNSPAVTDSSGNPQTNPTDPNAAPTLSSSSAAPTDGSSSSGLKDYDDNHKAKETFLPKAGFYSNLTIDPPTPQKGGEIRCTFDGSFPTQSSEQIAQAKQITQNTVVRCSEFVNGQAADTTTQTYFINETVTMPVVALTVNHHDMFDSTDGLYATGPLTNNQGGMMTWNDPNAADKNNPKCSEPCKQANFWREDELPVHVEFFENGSSTTEKNWEIDAGISIMGNYSRYKPKKSVAIKMDNDDYGDKVLKYSLFKTRPEAKKIKAFNLRNNGNRYWTDYIADAMMTSLLEGTDVDYQRSRQVVVFYNGEYFGIHDMRERLNRSFVETNYGIDSKSINMVKNCNGDNNCIDGWAASGTNGSSPQEFASVVNSITNGNFAGENNQQYEQLKEKINLSSFAQYMLAEMYFHNGDWPNNNIRAWGGNGNPFKFVAFDTDHGFGLTPGISGFDTKGENMFNWVLGADQGANQGGQQPGFGMGMGWSMGGNTTIGNMLKKLLENPNFKRLFINQACILLNDYLTYEKVQSTIQSMMATIPSSEQTRDEQRWPRGDGQSSFTWDPNGTALLEFASNRSQTVRNEMAERFGLQNETNVTISVSGSGIVKVDGMKLPSSNYQGKFFAGTSMELTAVPAAGRVFSRWLDGSTENPRVVQLNGGDSFTAVFE
ncbi:MAG: CotH kinase family protein [Fibrobacter sp.]|nr:CotH kinase family protein [Fibrobacter sp.]